MLINMTEAALLGTKAMLVLNCEPKTTESVAKEINASAAHMSKILQRLTRHGLARAVRGPKGGYMLNVPRSDIGVLDVVTAVDGQVKTAPEGNELHPVDRFVGRMHNDLAGKLGVRITEL